MSFGRSDPIRSLILHGSPSGFSRPAEGWSACSNDDILVAAAKQLGVLQQRREYRDDVGQARENWQQHRSPCCVARAQAGVLLRRLKFALPGWAQAERRRSEWREQAAQRAAQARAYSGEGHSEEWRFEFSRSYPH